MFWLFKSISTNLILAKVFCMQDAVETYDLEVTKTSSLLFKFNTLIAASNATEPFATVIV